MNTFSAQQPTAARAQEADMSDKEYQMTLTLDLSGGRNPSQELDIRYTLYPDTDDWNRDICDICIEEVLFSGVDVNDLLSDRDIREIERRIENALYEEAQAMEEARAVTAWEDDRSWLLRAQA